MCSLRVACNSAWRDGEGELQERPNYFDVSVFGGSAESVSQYMRRGSRVGVDGRLEWREWETADEQKRQAVSIVADTLQFLEGPRSGSGAPEQSDTELAGVAAADSEADLVF